MIKESGAGSELDEQQSDYLLIGNVTEGTGVRCGSPDRSYIIQCFVNRIVPGAAAAYQISDDNIIRCVSSIAHHNSITFRIAQGQRIPVNAAVRPIDENTEPISCSLIRLNEKAKIPVPLFSTRQSETTLPPKMP